jgi:UDP-N-acetylmuramate dehydrogenase
MYVYRINNLYSLKDHNTFGIEAIADYFIELNSTELLVQFLKNNQNKHMPKLVIGGGSNMLFVGNFKGIVINPNFQDIKILETNNEYSIIRCGAGVDWDAFVEWSVKYNLGGLENLSRIPGTVGASPIQNIGAYGVEVKDSIIKVEFYTIEDASLHSLNNYECEFGYRTSIFKTQLKDKVIVSHVDFRLNKKPEFKTDYGSLYSEVKLLGKLNLKNIRQAVINIRTSKLPDPKKIGNAGSFFKNPVVTRNQAVKLKQKNPDIPLYSSPGNMFKIPAAYLIEKCGWKGYRIGDAGVHEHQPLVLVNFGKAKGFDILDLSQKIQDSVFKYFQIDLETEVNIIG